MPLPPVSSRRHLRGAAAKMPCLVIAAVVAVACTSPSPGPPRRGAPSPPRFQSRVARAQARQFSGDDPNRPAGSQGEQIAASYLVAHLQSAGYVVFLDPVPVGDLVRSTNVVALPPAGGEPSIAVVAPYDTGPRSHGGAAALGVFLEVARALSAAAPRHAGEFVALGAERTDRAGGHLGSRRMVVYLRERDERPLIVSLAGVSFSGGSARAAGVRAKAFSRLSPSALPRGPRGPVAAVFQEAGFDVLTLSGGAAAVGRSLLEFLSETVSKAAAPHSQ